MMTMIFISIATGALLGIWIVLYKIWDSVTDIKNQNKYSDQDIEEMYETHSRYLNQIIDILIREKKSIPPTVNSKKSSPPSNRKPRTEAQKKKASELMKQRWAKKKGQMKSTPASPTPQVVPGNV